MNDATPDGVKRGFADPSDAALWSRACAEDGAAFEMLVRRHYRAVFAVALAIMGTTADAEDVCQDAFVRAATKLEECRQPERFAQWLSAIVRNHARNELMRPSVRRHTTISAATASVTDDTVHRLSKDHLRARLEDALGSLSVIQREVVLLHDLEGWSHEDIARSIGTSAGMSRQHLFKARRILREALGEELLREHFNE
jgi:RNA polymerase sigma-70 factor, ECF subfamily